MEVQMTFKKRENLKRGIILFSLMLFVVFTNVKANSNLPAVIKQSAQAIGTKVEVVLLPLAEGASNGLVPVTYNLQNDLGGALKSLNSGIKNFDKIIDVSLKNASGVTNIKAIIDFANATVEMKGIQKQLTSWSNQSVNTTIKASDIKLLADKAKNSANIISSNASKMPSALVNEVPVIKSKIENLLVKKDYALEMQVYDVPASTNSLVYFKFNKLGETKGFYSNLTQDNMTRVNNYILETQNQGNFASNNNVSNSNANVTGADVSGGQIVEKPVGPVRRLGNNAATIFNTGKVQIIKFTNNELVSDIGSFAKQIKKLFKVEDSQKLTKIITWAERYGVNNKVYKNLTDQAKNALQRVGSYIEIVTPDGLLILKIQPGRMTLITYKGACKI